MLGCNLGDLDEKSHLDSHGGRKLPGLMQGTFNGGQRPVGFEGLCDGPSGENWKKS
jgi:hypothetical protein